MKKLLFIIAGLAILVSCSSRKLLEKGKYDAAIRKSAKKLKRKPDKIKEIYVLEEAYNKANRRDSSKIAALRNEGNPENFDKIYQLYKKMDDRQNIVKPLPPLGVDFNFKDYSTAMGNAKQNAADYAYANGLVLLESGEREKARQAFVEFNKVKSYYKDYKDIDQKLAESKKRGTTNVLFKIENQSQVVLPAEFKNEIHSYNVNELDQQWVDYHNTPDSNVNFDYYVQLSLHNIEISPEQVKETEYTDQKKVEDGWEYVLDENGNVKKDTAGNDIKKTKYKTISCKVIESHQKKTANITGSLDYIRISDNKILKSEPVEANALFEHSSAIAVGNEEALTKASLKKIKSEPAPFPGDADLIMNTANIIKGLTADLMKKNKGVLK